MVEAWAAGLGVGYLIGSVPVGLWIGRLVQGIDLREVGSGRIGATNALRRLGPRWSLLIFGLDLLKGAGPLLIMYLVWDSPTAEALTGLAVVVGHVYPLFAGFRGGRGAAPGMGAMLVMTPIAAVVGFGVALVLLPATRIMSLTVLVGLVGVSLTQALLVAFWEEPVAYYGYATGTFVIIAFAHRDNIQRLLAGTEPKVGQSARRPGRPAEGAEPLS